MESNAFDLQKAVYDLRESVEANLKRAESDQKIRDEAINQRIDELQAKLERPGQPAKGGGSDQPSEYTKGFMQFVRTGENAILKGLSVGTNADGGYTVPEELDRMIYDLQQNFSPLRRLCNVLQVSTPDYKKLVNIHGATASWGAETTARANTNTPQFAELTPSMGELWAHAHATQQILDDSFVNLESWLAGEVADAFSITEAAAFISGNGTNRPKGFLAGNVVTSADSARTFGDVQYIASGGAGAFATNTPADYLIDVVYALKAGHRQGASWLAPKSVYQAMRKFKDSSNQYLWQPSLVAGQPPTVHGYPAIEDENMPALAANSLSLAFANWRRAYTIVDRLGTRVLRDPYTAKPYVVFYTTKRVGGFLVDSEAIKVMKFAAS